MRTSTIYRFLAMLLADFAASAIWSRFDVRYTIPAILGASIATMYLMQKTEEHAEKNQ